MALVEARDPSHGAVRFAGVVGELVTESQNPGRLAVVTVARDYQHSSAYTLYLFDVISGKLK